MTLSSSSTTTAAIRVRTRTTTTTVMWASRKQQELLVERLQEELLRTQRQRTAVQEEIQQLRNQLDMTQEEQRSVLQERVQEYEIAVETKRRLLDQTEVDIMEKLNQVEADMTNNIKRLEQTATTTGRGRAFVNAIASSPLGAVVVPLTGLAVVGRYVVLQRQAQEKKRLEQEQRERELLEKAKRQRDAALSADVGLAGPVLVGVLGLLVVTFNVLNTSSTPSSSPRSSTIGTLPSNVDQPMVTVIPPPNSNGRRLPDRQGIIPQKGQNPMITAKETTATKVLEELDEGRISISEEEPSAAISVKGATATSAAEPDNMNVSPDEIQQSSETRADKQEPIESASLEGPSTADNHETTTEAIIVDGQQEIPLGRETAAVSTSNEDKSGPKQDSFPSLGLPAPLTTDVENEKQQPTTELSSVEKSTTPNDQRTASDTHNAESLTKEAAPNVSLPKFDAPADSTVIKLDNVSPATVADGTSMPDRATWTRGMLSDIARQLLDESSTILSEEDDITATERQETAEKKTVTGTPSSMLGPSSSGLRNLDTTNKKLDVPIDDGVALDNGDAGVDLISEKKPLTEDTRNKQVRSKTETGDASVGSKETATTEQWRSETLSEGALSEGQASKATSPAKEATSTQQQVPQQPAAVPSDVALPAGTSLDDGKTLTGTRFSKQDATERTTTSDVGGRKLDLPKFGALKLTIPNIDVRNLNIPSLDFPTIDAPKIDLPKFDTRKIESIKFDMPMLDFSKYDAPKVVLPKLELPQLDNLRKLELPQLDNLRKLELPQLNNLRKLELPQFDASKLELAKFDLGKPDLSSRKLPKFKLNGKSMESYDPLVLGIGGAATVASLGAIVLAVSQKQLESSPRENEAPRKTGPVEAVELEVIGEEQASADLHPELPKCGSEPEVSRQRTTPKDSESIEFELDAPSADDAEVEPQPFGLVDAASSDKEVESEGEYESELSLSEGDQVESELVEQPHDTLKTEAAGKSKSKLSELEHETPISGEEPEPESAISNEDQVESKLVEQLDDTLETEAADEIESKPLELDHHTAISVEEPELESVGNEIESELEPESGLPIIDDEQVQGEWVEQVHDASATKAEEELESMPLELNHGTPVVADETESVHQSMEVQQAHGMTPAELELEALAPEDEPTNLESVDIDDCAPLVEHKQEETEPGPHTPGFASQHDPLTKEKQTGTNPPAIVEDEKVKTKLETRPEPAIANGKRIGRRSRRKSKRIRELEEAESIAGEVDNVETRPEPAIANGKRIGRRSRRKSKRIREFEEAESIAGKDDNVETRPEPPTANGRRIGRRSRRKSKRFIEFEEAEQSILGENNVEVGTPSNKDQHNEMNHAETKLELDAPLVEDEKVQGQALGDVGRDTSTAVEIERDQKGAEQHETPLVEAEQVFQSIHRKLDDLVFEAEMVEAEPAPGSDSPTTESAELEPMVPNAETTPDETRCATQSTECASDYDAIISKIFPGALSNTDLVAKVTKMVEKKGFTSKDTLLATSLCSDELARRLEDDFVKVYGSNFSLGGLSGFPFAGNTGFGAMTAHIPDGGSCLLVYGPHVGVTKQGVVGKVERAGIELVDNCCGSAIAASNYLLSITDGGALSTTALQEFTDFQQDAVQELILPHGKRLADSADRMVELPKALYDSQELLMLDIVQNGCGGLKKNGLALLGGIQINTAPDALDYFLPLRFDYIDNEGTVLEDMLGTLLEANKKDTI